MIFARTGIVLALACALPVWAGPIAKVFVDAGTRTAALSKILRDEGTAEIVASGAADLRIVLQDKGATWALAISDKKGAPILRRDISASGGELAALRVVAVLIEQAARTRGAPIVVKPVATSSVVAIDMSGRPMPPLPVPETAVLLLADASALPRETESATATIDAAALAVVEDSPDAPRIPGVRRRATADEPTPAAIPEPSPTPTPTPTPAPSPEPDPGPAVAEEAVDPAWRVVPSFGAYWWQTPGLAPQLGFGLGVERPVGPFVLGVGARLHGFPCCRRNTDLIEATALEIGGTLYALWAFYTGEIVRLHANVAADAAYVTGDASLVLATPGVTATTTPLSGVDGGISVGPAIELMLSRNVAIRLRVALRLSFAAYQVDVPVGFSGESLDTGRVNPVLDVSVPFTW